MALQRYLSQFCNDQVAFGVKQRKPKTIEAVGATLELESYLVQHSSSGTVALVQVDYVGQNNNNLMDMMSQLFTQMERLEMGMQHDKNTDGLPITRPETSGMVSRDLEVVICNRCGQEGHFTRGCAQSRRKHIQQGNPHQGN